MAAAGPLDSVTASAVAKPTIRTPMASPMGRRHHGVPPAAPEPDRPGGSGGDPGGGGTEDPDPDVPDTSPLPGEGVPEGTPDSGPDGGPDGPCPPPDGGPAGGCGGRRAPPLGGGDEGCGDTSVGGYCDACVGGCGGGSFSSPEEGGGVLLNGLPHLLRPCGSQDHGSVDHCQGRSA